MSEFTKAEFLVDIQGRWYLIPEHLREEFDRDRDENPNNPYMEDEDGFCAKWEPYYTIWGNFGHFIGNPFDVYIKMK